MLIDFMTYGVLYTKIIKTGQTKRAKGKDLGVILSFGEPEVGNREVFRRFPFP